jgi:hypothetical protein
MDLTGDCYEDESRIQMKWKGFTLNINFAKVENIEK